MLPFSTVTYLKIVRASAIYDLIVTVPFATPWTLQWLLGIIAKLSVAMSLRTPPPAYGVELGLFANLMGSVVVIWSAARLLTPSVTLGRLDGAARILFSLWFIYAATHGASLLVLGFLPLEIAFGAVQLAPVGKARAMAAVHAG